MPLETLSKYNQFFPCKELVIFNINTGFVRTSSLVWISEMNQPRATNNVVQRDGRFTFRF